MKTRAAGTTRMQSMVAGDRHCPSRFLNANRRHGFTLIELLVASVIVSVALLGVFSLMRQASQVEARAQDVWQARGRAEAVAGHMTSALKHAVVVGDLSGGGIQAGPDESGGYRLRVLVVGGTYDHGQGEPIGGTRWLEYRWFREAPFDTGSVAGNSVNGVGGTATDQPSSYMVELRSVLLAGDVLLTSDVELNNDDTGEGFDWDRIEPVVLATGLDAVDVAFQSVQDDQWQSEYGGPPADVMIRLRIRVAEETVERVLYARAMPDPSTENEEAQEPAAADAGGGVR